MKQECECVKKIKRVCNHREIRTWSLEELVEIMTFIEIKKQSCCPDRRNLEKDKNDSNHSSAS